MRVPQPLARVLGREFLRGRCRSPPYDLGVLRICLVIEGVILRNRQRSPHRRVQNRRRLLNDGGRGPSKGEQNV